MRSSRLDPDPLDPGPIGFAHRGLHGPGVPENSLAAFRAALELGAGIECDVHLSADGEVMILHDSDLRRMCGIRLTIETSRAEVIAGQRLFGSSETIPWLSELLDMVAGQTPLLIELKTRKGNSIRIAEAVAAELSDYAGPVGVMSFDPKVGWHFAREVPYLRRGLVIESRTRALDRWAAIGYASPHFLAVERTLLGSRWATKARRKRILYSWTIQTAAERAQAEVHADALIWEGDGRPRS
jgi:glycerophosphoryl diester phosphodiesterase